MRFENPFDYLAKMPTQEEINSVVRAKEVTMPPSVLSPAPQGTPLSEIILYDNEPTADTLLAVRAIESVHGFSGMGHLHIRNSDCLEARGEGGTFWCYPTRDGHLDRADVDPLYRDPAVALIHEVGHFLDMHGFDGVHSYASRRCEGDLGEVRRAIRATASNRRLVSSVLAQKQLGARGAQYDFDRNLACSEECFARAYTQWLIGSCAEQELRRRLAKLRSGSAAALSEYWSDEDFEPVAIKMHAAFRRAGRLE
jgi:hypothetical protein